MQPLFFYYIQPDSVFLFHVAGRVTAAPYRAGEGGKAGGVVASSAKRGRHAPFAANAAVGKLQNTAKKMADTLSAPLPAPWNGVS